MPRPHMDGWLVRPVLGTSLRGRLKVPGEIKSSAIYATGTVLPVCLVAAIASFSSFLSCLLIARRRR